MKGSISSVVPYAVIDAAGRAGAATEPLFRVAGLPHEGRPGADVHVAAARYIELWDAVLATVRVPAFGLRVAAGMELEDSEVFGFLAMSCATIGCAGTSHSSPRLWTSCFRRGSASVSTSTARRS